MFLYRNSQLNNALVASDNTQFRFGVTEDGKYGYIVTDEEGADTVVPFKKEPTKTQSITKTVSVSATSSYTWTYTFSNLEKIVGITYMTTDNPGSIAVSQVTINNNVVKVYAYATNNASNKKFQVNVIGY